MLLIDSDNAAGSPRGDVDDAFAIAALLRSGLPVAALASVAGNTSEGRGGPQQPGPRRALRLRGTLPAGRPGGRRRRSGSTAPRSSGPAGQALRSASSPWGR